MKKAPNSFFILAGELSGDVYGSDLIKSLQKQFPEALFEGVGGPEMRAQKFECLLPMENFALMGFSDVFAALPRIIRNFLYLRDSILQKKPDGVILIDYPGFNLMMASALRKKGYTGKLIQYVCPTIWAWGKKRKEKMVRNLDLLLTIFPFEPPLFQDTTLQVKYVGHPLVQKVNKHVYNDSWWMNYFKERPKKLIAIFPGSRKEELIRNLPLQLKIAELAKRKDPELSFALSLSKPEYREMLEKYNLPLIPKEHTYDLMREAKAAIAKSGSVTLELALHETPSVVLYYVSSFNRFLAKHYMGLKMPYYCIVNILLDTEVFPESIEFPKEEETMADHLVAFSREGAVRKSCLADCRKVKQLLETKEGSAMRSIKGLF